MKKHRKLITILIIGIIVCAIILTVAALSSNSQKQAKTIQLQVEKVQKQNITNKVTILGSVVPKEEVKVLSRVRGEVSEIHFLKGDYVQKGDLLLTIDTRELDNHIEKAKIALRKKEAQLDRERMQNISNSNAQTTLKNRYNLVSNELESMEVLYNNGAVSLKELEKKQIEAQQAYNEYLEAKNRNNSNLTVVELEYKELQLDYKNLLEEKQLYRITSPIDGVIVDIHIIESEIVSEDKELIHIINTNNLKVIGSVNEFESDSLELGDKFEIVKYGELYTGQITYISPVVKEEIGYTFSQPQKVIEIEGTLFNDKILMLPNSDVNIDLILQESQNTLVVPQRCIYTEEQINHFVVKVVDKGYKLISVDKGVQDLMNIEILSDELSEGDLVLVNPPKDLIESLRD